MASAFIGSARAIAEAAEAVLDVADRLAALAISDPARDLSSARMLDIAHTLFRNGRTLMQGLSAPPQTLAEEFQKVLGASRDLTLLADGETQNPDLHSQLMASASRLLEVGGRYATAIQAVTKSDDVAWARFVPQRAIPRRNSLPASPLLPNRMVKPCAARSRRQLPSSATRHAASTVDRFRRSATAR